MYREPNDREKLMADAYGGEAKPVPIKANRSITSARSKQGLTWINRRLASQHDSKSRLNPHENSTYDQVHTLEDDDRVNEAHEREQQLKQNHMDRIKNKSKWNKRLEGANSEFDRIHTKEVDDFLNNDSDWDIDSFVAPS